MHYPIIDAHQHFWKYDPLRDGWITDEMEVLKKDYLPSDIEPVFGHNHIAGSVAVQADPSENENYYLLDLGAQNPFIKGVVGWIDFESDGLEEKLDHYRQYKLMKGFRQLLQGEKTKG